jgi:Cys-tRNA(Pro) deacylase
MKRKSPPTTQALRALRARGIAFEAHPYDYKAGGTAEFAAQAGVDEHRVIKTLVMEDERGAGLIVLMHGDRDVATGRLARQIGAKRVRPCQPAVAEKHTGYRVGGTSPFGTRTALPVFCERSIAALEPLYINGGRRGLLVSLAAADLLRVLAPTLVDAAQ